MLHERVVLQSERMNSKDGLCDLLAVDTIFVRTGSNMLFLDVYIPRHRFHYQAYLSKVFAASNGVLRLDAWKYSKGSRVR